MNTIRQCSPPATTPSPDRAAAANTANAEARALIERYTTIQTQSLDTPSLVADLRETTLMDAHKGAQLINGVGQQLEKPEYPPLESSRYGRAVLTDNVITRVLEKNGYELTTQALQILNGSSQVAAGIALFAGAPITFGASAALGTLFILKGTDNIQAGILDKQTYSEKMLEVVTGNENAAIAINTGIDLAIGMGGITKVGQAAARSPGAVSLLRHANEATSRTISIIDAGDRISDNVRTDITAQRTTRSAM